MANTKEEFDKAVEQEAAYLRRVHPTLDDIPTCINLLDDFLLCSSMYLFSRWFLRHSYLICPSEIRNSVRDVYRYGERRDCNPKWDDYKFCLTLKFKEDDDRYEGWIKRRATWWAKRRLDKSSEDVWAMRKCVPCLAGLTLTNWLVAYSEPLQNYPPPIVDEEKFKNETKMW
jgi:hypothetical protein